jgi:hypothetical protein
MNGFYESNLSIKKLIGAECVRLKQAQSAEEAHRSPAESGQPFASINHYSFEK